MTLELAEPQVQAQPQVQGQEVAGDLKANGGFQPESNGNGPELELHRACVEGQLDEVRAVLSRGLEQLEQLDMSTGCTPIVLAIRANHVEVVRELLTAGAIVPPPGLTNDPVMLSLLYPQPMYGLPMQFMGHHQPMSMPAEFYPQHGSYAQHQQHQQHPQQPQQQANLPPAEVAKTIPCRNFPNCKYGSACVFFHPRGQATFTPGQFNGGYEQPYPQHSQVYQHMPYFTPQQNGFQPQQQIQDPNENQHQQHQQQQQQQSTISALPSIDGSAQVPISENDPSSTANSFNDQTQQPIPQQQTLPPPHELSTAPAPFVPYGMTSPTQPQFGMSPMSPPMMPMSPHDAAAAAAFYASSPPNGGMMMPPPMAGFVPRRQSINQGPGGYQGQGGKPFGGHGKKPSFSGGPRPWAGAGGRGGAPSWKDGNPPPCTFFAQGKCRNGEFCKFPHLDQEGADSRHPDIIRGLMAPAPPFARVARLPRMGNFSQFDPTRQFVPRPQVNGEESNGQVAAVAEDVTAAATESAPVATTGTETEAPKAQQQEQESAEKPVPAQAPVPQQPTLNVPNPNNNGNAAANGIARSASQPGVQRLQPNGFHSRSQSPASSNVSFHGNGHPRRGGRPFNAGMHNGNAHGANGQAGRSVSAGENKQRVPNADEFPALGGVASGNTSPQEKSSATFSKTAAQVLSAPAPPKPEAPAPTPKREEPSSSEDVVTMDDESDSDAVLISVTKSSTPAPASTEEKKSESATPAAAPASAPAPVETKRSGPISFASVASSVASAAGLTTSAPSTASAPLESAPVALKA